MRVTHSNPDRRARPDTSPTLWPDIFLSLGIFSLAFAVRISYLFQIKSFPLFYHLVGDARSYDEWAQRIAAGDWLGREVFYQAPLYPYFLGLLQFLIGRDLWWIRVIQIALGALSCSLVYWAGKSFFDRPAGIAAALIVSLYAPAIFSDGLLQKSVLDVFLVSLALALLAGAPGRPDGAILMASGIVLGLLALSRENALIWLLVVPAWIWLFWAEHPVRRRARWLGAFLLGASLVLLPVGLRNLTVGGVFTLTTAQLMGPNFFMGNNPRADGTYIPFRAGRGDPKYERQDIAELAEQAVGRPLSPGEVSAYWLRRSWDYIRSQPVDWLRLLGRKWMLLWNVRELEDADDFYLYERWSAVLGALGWTTSFGWLAPLAAVGGVLTWQQWRRLSLLYALLLSFALAVTLFIVVGRYRMAMVPMLALFAGAFLGCGGSIVRERRFRQGVVALGVLLLALAVVHWPVMGKPGPSATGLNNLGTAFVAEGRLSMAVQSYRLALQVEPKSLVVHYNLANALITQGQLDAARHHLEEAVRINPSYAEAHQRLGEVMAVRGDLETATIHFREAIRIRPGFAEAEQALARALLLQSRKR
ncbi:MAG: tetratricopeptide repeat protein [Candidatus Rokubacteria bacterium]|nr:tetratricopeptide repeat protein [Candidatus Rokubacteria bacterium]MBI4593027.1 tetratricopeptide repeat protein [Candidatus Rokubacteria bacterium]